MIAVARYALVDHSRNLAALPPVVVFCGLLLLFYASDPGPILAAYGMTSVLLMLVTVWLTTGVFAGEDPVQADIVAAASGGRWRSAAGRTCAASLIGLALAVFGTLVPIPTQGRTYAASLLIAGALAHCSAMLVGVAIGLCCRREVVPRIGYSWSVAAILGICAFALPVSPVNWAFAWMGTNHRHAHLPQLAAMAAISAAYLVVCFVGTQSYVRRRGH